MTLLIATSNPGKLADLRASLAGAVSQLLAPDDLGLALTIEEPGPTYADNARLKARAYFDATGISCVGEDSGLEIRALEGEPGVFSARYQGLPDGALKNARLLELMAGVQPRRRGCRYRCALVLVEEADGREQVFEGSCSGRVALAPAGEGGFGFDPIVLIPRLGRTLAELPEDERRRINHRGRAARKLRAHLRRAKLQVPGSRFQDDPARP